MNVYSLFSGFDVFVSVIIGAVIIVFAWVYRNLLHHHKPEYRYLIPGLFFKMVLSIMLAYIYTLYYGGGDTTDYYYNSTCISNLFFQDPWEAIRVIFGHHPANMKEIFNLDTGLPLEFMYRDYKTWAVARFSAPFAILGFGRFVQTTMLVGVFAFAGSWKFFMLMNRLYPAYRKHLAIAALFIPSAVLWSGGILKDSFTYAASLWLIANYYKVFVFKEKRLINLLLILLNSYMIIMIKPYIFIALAPSVLILGSLDFIRNIKNRIIRYLAAPFLLLTTVFLMSLGYSSLSDNLGSYGNIESMLIKAQITQNDLIRAEAYGSNSYNIGTFTPTIGGVIAKIPVAMMYGLYGPFIWEIRNPLMAFSALESFILLLLSLYIILKVRWRIVSLIAKDNFLVFALIFSFIFIFFVGLSTANYGALSRYRILALPIFLSFLFILLNRVRNMGKDGEEER